MTIALLGIANIYNGFQKFMATALHFENEDVGQPSHSASASVSISIQPTAFKPSSRALRVCVFLSKAKPPLALVAWSFPERWPMFAQN